MVSASTSDIGAFQVGPPSFVHLYHFRDSHQHFPEPKLQLIEVWAPMGLVRTNIPAKCFSLDTFYSLIILNIFQVLNNFVTSGTVLCPGISTIFFSADMDCDSSERF